MLIFKIAVAVLVGVLFLACDVATGLLHFGLWLVGGLRRVVELSLDWVEGLL